MNCKPGDIAEYVGNQFPELRGRRMVCVRLNTATEGQCGYRFWEPNWIVVPPMPWPDPEMAPTVADRVLWPVQDTGGEDETLTWAGKPQEVTA